MANIQLFSVKAFLYDYRLIIYTRFSMNINASKSLKQTDMIDADSINDVFIELYPEIKKIAQSQVNHLQPGQTITATVLVNECYLKLQKKLKLKIRDEKHFFCLTAKCMKHYLIDQIRGKNRDKRNAALQTSLVTQLVGEQNINIKLIEVIRAVDQLEDIDQSMSELVNLHCFGGFTFDELSHTLKKSKRQLLRKWQVAKTVIISLLDEAYDK